MASIQDLADSLDEQASQKQDQQHKVAQIEAVQQSGQQIVGELQSLKDVLLASPIAKDKKVAQVATKLAGLITQIDQATASIRGANFKPLADNLSQLDKTVQSLPGAIGDAHLAVDPRPHLEELNSTLKKKNFQPIVNVPEVDLSSITSALKDVKVAVGKIPKTDNSQLENLIQSVTSSVNSVTKAVQALRFPVPNYVLPFRSVDGKAVQVQLDASGNLPIASSGGSGGTQYTDGSGTITHPIGTIPVFDKAGTITAVSSANPLPTSASFSPSGTQDVNLKQVGAATLTIGQQLAAASIPVILPSATVTTLTPPSNTGYALDASLTTIDTDLKSNITLHAGTNLIGKVGIDQTTPGTTNGVVATLNAETTKVIGTVNVAASQTIAVTNAGTFAVQAAATLAAETTKVIGTVRTADGTGNLYTSNSTTFTAKNAQDTNLLGTLGTAFSTAGKVDVKGADGDIFVRQATGTNLHAVLDSGTLTTLTTLTGTTTLTPGTGQTNLGKAEDLASADGDVGVGTLGIRKAAPANTSGTDGDYEFMQLNAGRQWVWAQPNINTLTTGITRPADGNAYAANDAFANSTSAPTSGGFTFTSAALASGGSGVITDCVVSASAGTLYNGEVWIFDQAVTATNDNAALSVSDSDILNLVGVIPFQTTDVNAANSISYVTGLNIGYNCVGTANLRFLVKIMAAVTPASAEVLTVRIKVSN